MALLVLNEIDALREKSQKYVAVGSIGFDKDRHLFGVGPFTTELQAERGGEAFAWDPKTKTGAGRYWVVPLVGKGRDAWDLVRPAVVSRNEMIADRVREYIAAQKEGRSYVDPHEGKQGW